MLHLKRFLAFFPAIALCFACLITADAAQGSSVTTTDVVIKNGRLFNVSVGLSCKEVVTAATFTLSFDGDYFEFREIEKYQTDCTVRAVSGDGMVKAIFLCPNGVNAKKGQALFSVKLKGVKSGKSRVKISASDCVNDKVKNFASPESAYCNVTVFGGFPSSAGSRGSGSGPGSSSSRYRGNYSSSGSSENNIISAYDGDGENEGILSAVNSLARDGTSSAIMTWVLLGAVVVACVFTAFMAGRSSKKEKSKKDTQEDKENKEKEESKE